MLVTLFLAIALIPARAQKPCYVVGDSIANGVASRLHECGSATKVGINTADALIRFKVIPKTDFVVISLGSNDAESYPLTEANVREMRSRIHAAHVIWIVPAAKAHSKKHKLIENVATSFGDLSMSFTPGRDGTHPTRDGYNTMAATLRGLHR